MVLTRALGERWDDVNAAHVALIRAAVDAHRGTVVRTEGDAVFAAFGEAGAAVAAAVAAQRSLQAHAWPEDATIRVRMGVHSGEAHRAGDDYGGIEVSRAARVAAVGHGGQIVLSGPTYELDRRRPAGRHDRPRPRPVRPQGRAPTRAAVPARRSGAAGRVSAGPRRPDDGRQPRAAADDLRRARRPGRGAPGAAGRRPARDHHRARAGSARRASPRRRPARVEAEYADGAWFVPLATIEDPADVKALVARTIGLFDGTSRSAVETLPAFLAERSMLLVLDNFEHVLDAARRPSPSSSASSPRSRFVVTSRAPLRVTGEHEMPMAPLGVRRRGLGRATALRRAGAGRPPELGPGPGRGGRRRDLRARRWPAARASSWPPPGCRSCRWPRSATASRPGCRCRGAAPATFLPASGRSRAPSPGATTSCRRASSGPSTASRSSRVRSTPTRRARSWPTRTTAHPGPPSIPSTTSPSSPARA